MTNPSTLCLSSAPPSSVTSAHLPLCHAQGHPPNSTFQPTDAAERPFRGACSGPVPTRTPQAKEEEDRHWAQEQAVPEVDCEWCEDGDESKEEDEDDSYEDEFAVENLDGGDLNANLQVTPYPLP